jgi:hypothetical protein
MDDEQKEFSLYQHIVPHNDQYHQQCPYTIFSESMLNEGEGEGEREGKKTEKKERRN